MQSLNSLSESTIKAFFALIIILALTAGFFMKLVDSTVFTGVAMAIVTHYYNTEQVKQLNSRIDEKKETIKTLMGNASSVATTTTVPPTNG
jgi:hypothetical protein